MSSQLPESAYTLDADELPREVDALTFPNGDYAVAKRLKRAKFDDRLEKLQIELVKLQKWVRDSGERIVMVFEGRDAAGKGGTIKRFMAYMNPRHAHVVALSKPSDVERGQWYFQRYVTHLPTEGDMALFDRSWYNRAGVERVMGFCSEDDVETFFLEAPVFEGMMAREGIHVFKFWLTIQREEQLKRFYERKTSPLKNWKLSPMDHASIGKWHDYTKAIHDMLRITDTPHAPWTVVDANDQRRARLECIKTVLHAFDYPGKDASNIRDIDERITMSVDDFLKREGA